MKKIRINGREYNVSKTVYNYIKEVSADKRKYKLESSVNGRRSVKEIEAKINEIYGLINDGKLETGRGIIVCDALSWVLGEDYLDEYPYILVEEEEDIK